MGILSLNQMVVECTLLEMFSIMNYKVPLLLLDAWRVKVNNRNTRSGQKLEPKEGGMTMDTFVGRGTYLWNALPNELKALQTKVAFKLQLRKWILSNIELRIG